MRPAARLVLALALATAGLLAFPPGRAVAHPRYAVIEKMAYAGWPHCLKLKAGPVELIATTDVGPRVIRFGFAGGPNFFAEIPGQVGKTGGTEWRNYGGHRLWHAPEAVPRTYWPDNDPVPYTWNGKTLTLSPAVETTSGIAKSMAITMDAEDGHVTVVHRLTNRGLWPIEVAPWALSVMAPGGRAIFPQEPFKAHPEALLPVRPLVLWAYTDMQDPRWTWGTRYIQLRQDPHVAKKQKVGMLNTPGWAAYTLGGSIFLKRFPGDPQGHYADYGCNMESFVNDEILEIETLGQLATVQPGGSVSHTERWFLAKGEVGDDEAAIDRALAPLLTATKRFAPH